MNNKLAVAALIFPLMMTSTVAYSADTINTFDDLKKAIEEKKDNITLGADISFSEKKDFTAAAFDLKNGDKTEANLTIDGDGHILRGTTFTPTKGNSDAFSLQSGSSLTLKNVTVKDFIGSSSAPWTGAITLHGGTLTLTAEQEKNVVFENNNVERRGGGGDIYLGNEAKLIVNGTGGQVALKTGVFGSGTITHSGNSALVLGGTNSAFTGSFTNTSGDVEVTGNSTLFGKSNTFQSGTLKWNSKSGLSSGSTLSLSKGTGLIVGENKDVDAKLTLKNGQTKLENGVSLTTKNNGELILSGWTDQFKEKVSGNGKLTLQNTNLTITNDEIAENDLLQVKLDEQSAVTGSDLSFASLNNGGTVTANDELDVQNHADNSGTVSGKTLKVGSLNNTGKVTVSDALTVSGTGLGESDKIALINGVQAVTAEADGAEATSAQITADSLTVTGDVSNNGTITVTNDAKISGNLANESGTFSAKGLTVDGNITNNGTVTLQEALSGQKLTNTGTVTAASVTVSDAVENSGTITANGELKAGNVKNETQDGKITLAGGTIGGTVENDGTIENSGKLTIEGAVSGKGTLKNTGTLTLNADSRSFTGTFTQTGESSATTVVNGTLGGTKDIQSGSLTMSSSTLYNGQVKLGSNAQLDFTLQAMEDKEHHNVIGKDSLAFTGSDATAAFKGVDKSHLTLADDVENSKDNNISFDNTTLGLSGTTRNYDYKSFELKNSTLSLGDESGTLEDYSFNNFKTSGSSVDLNLKLSAEDELSSDTLTFNGNSSGTLNVGKVYLTDESKNNDGSYTAEVVKNEGENSHVQLGIEGDDADIHVASSKYTYDLEVQDGKDVSLTKTGDTTNETLADLNRDQQGTRDFEVIDSYTTDKDLGKTREGTILVYGESKTGADVLDGGGHSLFDIEKNTEVQVGLSDLTVQNAATTNPKGGSVVHNESDSAKVELKNVTVKNNKGAVYNKGGHYESGDYEDAQLLSILDATFSGNAAGVETGGSDTLGELGAAVYNDNDVVTGGRGVIYMEDVSFEKGTEEAQNDIYNAGDIYVNSEDVKNRFGSKITNVQTGLMEFYGQNEVSDIDNEGQLKFAGESVHIENLNTNGGTVLLESQNATLDSVSNTGGNIVADNGTNTTIDQLNLLTKTETTVNTFSSETTDNAKGKLTVEAGNVTLNTVTGDADTTIENSQGNLFLNGSAFGFTGTFTQESGTTTVAEEADFFGGISTVSGGTLYWKTINDLDNKAKLSVNGDSQLVIGNFENVQSSESQARSAEPNVTLTLQNGSSVNAKVALADGASLNVNEAGSATLNDGSYWSGTITVNGGDLTVNAQSPIQTATGSLKASKGAVTLNDGSSLNVNADSFIDGAVTFTGAENTNLFVSGGSVTLNEGDTVEGHTALFDGGTLTYEGTKVGDNASLTATDGNLNIVKGSSLTVDAEKNTVADAVHVTIDKESSVAVKNGGSLSIDDADSWGGQITLDDGSLTYGAKDNGILTANTGSLNLISGSELTLNSESEIKDAVSIDIQNGATVKVDGGALTLNSHTEDKWHGLIENNGGTLTTLGVDTTTEGFAGQFKQSSGTSVFDAASNIVIANPNTAITGGNVSVLSGSHLSFVDGENIQLNNLTVSGNSSFGIKNEKGQTVTLDSLTIDGENNFDMDLQGAAGDGDLFVIKDLKGSGTINVSDFAFAGSVPTTRQVDMQLFQVENGGEGVSFNSTSGAVSTPLGDYILQSLGNGSYRATLDKLNPDVYRGQASTLAMYNNQLEIDDMILNHAIVENGFGQQAAAQSKADRTRLNEDGGLWSKAYYHDGNMDLSRNLDMDTTAYGLFIGADLPMTDLGCGWNFVPTVFAGYNGSKQEYNDIDMKQNGGQGGVMGTFAKNDFVTSVMAYAGGYSNKMKGHGYEDSTHNWFVGTAAKAAYNWHVADQVVVQPTAFVSYNTFGKQDWTTQFGNMNMSTDTLNGFSVAPGINVIYAPKTWSTYASLQYVYNVNNKVGGRAGTDVDLPKLKTDNGFVQYGIGATKMLGDQWNTDFRVTAESGGRTGVGFRLGIEYLFGVTK